MARGIGAVCDWVIATVTAASPSVWPDNRFQCRDDSHGRAPRLQDWRQMRGFEIAFTDDRLPTPRQDFLPCGRTGHYMTALLTVWIRYEMGGSRLDLLKAMATDASIAGGALLDPSGWNESTTGIYHVEVLPSDEPEKVYSREVEEDPDGASHEADVLAQLAPLNLRVEYEED